MFSIKYQFGQIDEYKMYSAYEYVVRPMEIPVPSDEERASGKKGIRTGRMQITITPEKDAQHFDIYTDKNHIIYVMNDAGQTIDIIYG